MGNTGSTSGTTSGTTSGYGKCGACSQNGNYFSFGKKTDAKFYMLVKNKPRRVYMDSKGSRRYYKDGTTKKYLPPGTKTYRKSPVKRPRKSPMRKAVKNKKDKKIGYRLSARGVYNDMGSRSVGKTFSILQKDGTYKVKVLRLRKNNSPYFANNFGSNAEFQNHIIPCKANGLKHLNIPINNNWLRGSQMDDMTGYKNSWPIGLIPPGGVLQPNKMSILPKMAYGRSYFG